MKDLILTSAWLSGAMLLAACEPNPDASRIDTSVEVTTVSLQSLPAGVKNGSGLLTLTEFTQVLAVWDESIQAQALEVGIAQQEAIGSLGQFEPSFYAEINRSGEFTQTSAADFLSTGTGTDAAGTPNPYSEKSVDGKIGIAMKDTSGITLDLYYEMGAIKNSLQAAAGAPSPERSAAIGMTVRAPLARGAGEDVNAASNVVAVIDEDIARETVRLIKTQRAYDGIQTYLFVQRAQERVRLREQSANLAAQLQRELSQQVSQGMLTQSVLTQASADVAERRAALTLAQQELNEQTGALQIFLLALNDQVPNRRWMPATGLSPMSIPTMSNSLNEVYAKRPETRLNALRIERQEILTMVAENGTLPEANLVIDFSKNRLSGDYIPFRSVFTNSNPYETWRIGFEFRRGLGGDIAENAAFEAAKLRERQAELTMRAYRQRVASEMNGIGSIVARSRENLRYQDEIIAAQNRLLRTERTSANEGGSSAIDVLRARMTLSLAQEARADAIAQLNLSSYLASQVDGTLLQRLDIE